MNPLTILPINRETLADLLTFGTAPDTFYEWDVEVIDNNSIPLVEQALVARGARNIRTTSECTLRVDSPIRMNFDGITGLVGVKEIKDGR
jgi:hypothetical protein